jgi:hypothetical protein
MAALQLKALTPINDDRAGVVIAKDTVFEAEDNPWSQSLIAIGAAEVLPAKPVKRAAVDAIAVEDVEA